MVALTFCCPFAGLLVCLFVWLLAFVDVSLFCFCFAGFVFALLRC